MPVNSEKLLLLKGTDAARTPKVGSPIEPPTPNRVDALSDKATDAISVNASAAQD